jgi:Protein of unknown function (DUF3465)
MYLTLKLNLRPAFCYARPVSISVLISVVQTYLKRPGFLSAPAIKLAFVFCACVFLSACAPTAHRSSWAPAKEAQVIDAQDQQARAVEVTVTAPVRKILPDDTEGLPHQRFLLGLSNGSTVLVAHNTSEATRVEVAEGDIVTVHGEYIWNAKGGVIHWTHHSDNGRHEGGYIERLGKRYQ